MSDPAPIARVMRMRLILQGSKDIDVDPSPPTPAPPRDSQREIVSEAAPRGWSADAHVTTKSLAG
eukprot:5919211-Pyramimonas_sp.AAC.1